MNSKNTKIENYVLKAIESSDYGLTTKTPKSKINFLVDTFMSEYWHDYNIKRFKGNIEKCISEWLSGLPSCINIVFYYNEIREKGISLGLISKNATEKQFEKFESDWFNLLAKTIVSLYKKHGGSTSGLKAYAAKGLVKLCSKTVGVTGRRKKDGTQKKGYIAKQGGKLVKKTTKKVKM